jgi:c-di-GMP-binding flagellar brake protein YcgR
VKNPKKDNRKYVRLDMIFPVEFNVVDKDRKPVSAIMQGFTRNVGKGGMCIESKFEKNKKFFDIVPGKTVLKLVINIPSSSFATDSYAVVKWVKKVSEYIFDTYMFGVEYEEIDTDNQKMIERHVLWLHRKPKVLLIFFVALLIFAVLLTYFNLQSR